MTKQKRKAKTAKIGKTNLKHIYSLPLTRAPQLLLEYRAVVLVFSTYKGVCVIFGAISATVPGQKCAIVFE